LRRADPQPEEFSGVIEVDDPRELAVIQGGEGVGAAVGAPELIIGDGASLEPFDALGDRRLGLAARIQRGERVGVVVSAGSLEAPIDVEGTAVLGRPGSWQHREDSIEHRSDV